MKLLFVLLFIAPQILEIIESVSWGEFISIEQAPYFVSLITPNRTHYQYFCGGSIISEYWIVTAAHCIGHVKLHADRVICGESIIHERKRSSTYKIDKIILHGSHVNAWEGFDIALIKLKKPIVFNERRQPIKIRRVPPKEGETLTVMGFGDQGAAKGNGQVLRQTEVTVVDDECYNLREHPTVKNVGGFCAGNGTNDACPGDSGGPGVINGELAGITSFGPDCEFLGTKNNTIINKPSDRSKEPEVIQLDGAAVYTRVDAFYDWIVNITGLENL